MRIEIFLREYRNDNKPLQLDSLDRLIVIERLVVRLIFAMENNEDRHEISTNREKKVIPRVFVFVK